MSRALAIQKTYIPPEWDRYIGALARPRTQLLREQRPDRELAVFYDSLFESEARHHSTYVRLAKDFAPEETIRARLAELAALPQTCLRNDRRSAYEQFGMPLPMAMAREFELGMQTIETGEHIRGAARFSAGAGRHGARADGDP